MAGTVAVRSIGASLTFSSSSAASTCASPASSPSSLAPYPRHNYSYASTSTTARPWIWACKSELKNDGSSVSSSQSLSSIGGRRISPAEAARTLVDVCSEGTLCTCAQPDGWPCGTAVKFAVEAGEGLPVLHLHPSALHTQHLQADPRCSLHIQMEQPGHRKPQCTFKGQLLRASETSMKQKLKLAWERRFEEEIKEVDYLHFMDVDNVLQASDFGEEIVWVSSTDYKQAVADPLRECAARIVEDMNRNHWEDVRRFCKVYAHMDVMVEEARITWVDRLGFDIRVLTSSHEIMEARIPFSREVVDERDARSSLTMMAQIAWEFERNYCPPEIQMVRS